MGGNKTATLTLRIEPKLKESLRAAAEREHRSIANMIEKLIREYCDRHDISATDMKELLAKNEDN